MSLKILHDVVLRILLRFLTVKANLFLKNYEIALNFLVYKTIYIRKICFFCVLWAANLKGAKS